MNSREVAVSCTNRKPYALEYAVRSMSLILDLTDSTMCQKIFPEEENFELLTIVIPTRNRPHFLKKCLHSAFERQAVLPKVIVSDNSTRDQPAIRNWQAEYGFESRGCSTCGSS